MKLSDKNSQLLLIAFLTIIFTGVASAQAQISTTPGFLDAGELEPGTEAEITYFVSVTADENVTLDVEVTEPISSRLWGDDIPIEENEYSQEDISGWVDAPDQITVDPSNEVNREFGGGNAELVVEIDIPDDAEPGYHAGMVRLDPVNVDLDDGFGAGAYSASIPEFMFRVPGEASRQIELSDLEAIRTGEEEVQLLATFRNTGTVTVRSEGGEAEVVNNNGRSEGTVYVSEFTVSPGETTQVDATWSGTDGGQYSLEGTVDYITGEAYVGPPTAEFAITGAIQEAVDVQEGSESSSSSSNDSTPLWIVIMVLVILGAILYSMDIDPFWIVLMLGFIGILSAIVFTGLPNWLLILLVVGLAVAYYM